MRARFPLRTFVIALGVVLLLGLLDGCDRSAPPPAPVSDASAVPEDQVVALRRQLARIRSQAASLQRQAQRAGDQRDAAESLASDLLARQAHLQHQLTQPLDHDGRDTCARQVQELQRDYLQTRAQIQAMTAASRPTLPDGSALPVMGD